MPKEFIPAANIAELSQRAKEAVNASGALMQTMAGDLQQSQWDAIERVLRAGGSFGIESLVDHSGRHTVCLVAIELEGARHVIAEVKTIGASAQH